MHLQALVLHMYVAQPPRNRKPSRSGAASCSPAHKDDTFLPLDSVRVSSTVAGYVYAPPVLASNPRSSFARLLGGSAAPPLQNAAAHVYRYLRRTFALWPVGQSREALAEVLQLWLAVCLPWQTRDASLRCGAYRLLRRAA